jgi:hypothetical protein
MARLLVGSEWYEGLASTAHYEFEFETLVEQHAQTLFPGWTPVAFKVDVESESGRRRPDLALIDDQYRAWWVVEVELAHHSLDGHVLPQVETFASGRYTSDHAAHLARLAPDLDAQKLREMLRGEQPRVLVVVDQVVPAWTRPLARLGVLVSVVEIFRSDRNRICLRVNGDQPRPPGGVVTSLRRHRLLPRAMIVASPVALGGGPGSRYVIELDGSATEWTRVDTRDQVLLRARKTDPLSGWERVAIVKLADGRLAFGEDD